MAKQIPYIALLFFAGIAVSAEPKATPTKLPTEVETASVHPAHPPQPTEVKIVSTPATLPTEVKILSAPPDPENRNMVFVTIGVLVANVLLCVVTVWSTRRQGRDLLRRDRVTMEREINRSAQRNSDHAKRLFAQAAEIPKRFQEFYEIIGNQVPHNQRPNLDHIAQALQNRIRPITDRSAEILSKDLLVRESKSDEEIIALLWTVDSQELHLKDLEDDIARELSVIAKQEAEQRAVIDDFKNRRY